MRSLLPTQLDILADLFLHWYFLPKANKHTTKLDFQKEKKKKKAQAPRIERLYRTGVDVQPKPPSLVKIQVTKKGNQTEIHGFEFKQQLSTHVNGDRLVQRIATARQRLPTRARLASEQ